MASSGSGLEPSQQEHHAGQFQPTAVCMYQRDKRTRTDVGWTAAFCVFAALVLLSSWAIIPQSLKQDHTLRTAAFFNESMSCDAVTYDASVHAPLPKRSLREHGEHDSHDSNDDQEDTTDSDASMAGHQMAIWVPITVLCGLPLSILYVWLFRRAPKAMVWASVISIAVTSFLSAIACFAAGGAAGGIVLLVYTLIICACIYFGRRSLNMCSQLMSVAGTALMENFKLVPAVLVVNLFSVGAVIYLLVVLVLAANITDVIPNPQRVIATQMQGSDVGMCVDVLGNRVSCCSTRLRAFPTFFIILTSIFGSWLLNTCIQIKLSMTADLTAQWYYRPAGAFTNDPSSQPSLKLAVKHSLTTGFGTAAFAAFILTALEWVRSVIRNAEQKYPVLKCLSCWLQCIIDLVEKFTTFAAIAAAVTAKPLFPAASQLFEAFKRNGFKTASLWFLPGLVVGMTVLMMSVMWAVLIGVALYAQPATTGNVAVLVAVVVFIVMYTVLTLTAGVLMDIINTVYVLYVLDRDAKVVTRPEVHSVYQEVTIYCGAVVENPDGGMQYGAAEAGQGAAMNAHPAAQDTQPLMTGHAAMSAPVQYQLQLVQIPAQVPYGQYQVPAAQYQVPAAQNQVYQQPAAVQYHVPQQQMPQYRY